MPALEMGDAGVLEGAYALDEVEGVVRHPRGGESRTRLPRVRLSAQRQSRSTLQPAPSITSRSTVRRPGWCYAFLDEGPKVTVVSVRGGEVLIDRGSAKAQGQNAPAIDPFLADEAAMPTTRDSATVGAVDPGAYDAVVLPGEHGTMWDVPGSTAMVGLIGRTGTGGRVVASVCRGPAGLVKVGDAAGQPVVERRRVARFANL